MKNMLLTLSILLTLSQANAQQRIFADTANNRVVIFEPGLSRYTHVVLGQVSEQGKLSLDYTNIPNKGGVSPMSLNSPQSAVTDGQHLFVADTKNNRVLIWNRLPTRHASSNLSADLVLGQPDFNSNSPKTLNKPSTVYSDGHKLVVVDAGNNRILIWKTIPTVNNQAADAIVDLN